MSTFVHATEYWVPSRDRMCLELGGGLYGALDDFRRESEGMRFAYGEGLPGTAWASRRPVVLTGFEDTYFRRTEAARAAGLATGVAVPIFAGDFLTSVLVFFCGADPALVGAIELWRNEDASLELSLAEGYYGAASSFRWTSREARFHAGHGLPGEVWATGRPRVDGDFGRSSHFLRADEALRAGIDRGIGLPCGEHGGEAYVITMLSGMETPIAHRLEIWVPDASQEALRFESGCCDVCPTYLDRARAARVPYGVGVLGRPARTGVPSLSAALDDDASELVRAAAADGLVSVCAMPILEEGTLRAVVAFYF